HGLTISFSISTDLPPPHPAHLPSARLSEKVGVSTSKGNPICARIFQQMRPVVQEAFHRKSQRPAPTLAWLNPQQQIGVIVVSSEGVIWERVSIVQRGAFHGRRSLGQSGPHCRSLNRSCPRFDGTSHHPPRKRHQRTGQTC